MKCFRQVQPSATNHAVNMLSEEIQQRNMKKVKVNVQITFIIYIIESVANVSVWVVWFLVFQKSNDVSRMLSVLWYHLILPYIFLMNTSHNKNLVVDDGWETTIRNTFINPRPFNFFKSATISNIFRRFNRNGQNMVEQYKETDSVNSDSNMNKKTECSHQNCNNEEKTTSEVLSVSKSVEAINRRENGNTINIPYNLH